jgi:hypothetical protein
MTATPTLKDGRSYDWITLSLERTAVRFVSTLIASKEIGYLCRDYDFDNLLEATEDTIHSDLTPMVIELATCYRLIYWNAHERLATKDVGELVDHNGKSTPLSAIEACNKIIHAEKISFKVRKVRKFPLDYIEPELKVIGKKNKKRWFASIDLLRFTNEILTRHPTELDIAFNRAFNSA